MLRLHHQEVFIVIATGELYTHARPQGILNATSYFQATMTTVHQADIKPLDQRTSVKNGLISASFQ